MEMISQKIERRFWPKVDVRGPGECWPWMGALTGAGYGVLQINHTTVGAHRIMFRLKHGNPGKLFVCHHCDRPDCVNPAHLWAGTCRETMQDGSRKGRVGTLQHRHYNSLKTHCPYGHPLDGMLKRGPHKGTRYCRVCSRARTQRWRRHNGR